MLRFYIPPCRNLLSASKRTGKAIFRVRPRQSSTFRKKHEEVGGSSSAAWLKFWLNSKQSEAGTGQEEQLVFLNEESREKERNPKR